MILSASRRVPAGLALGLLLPVLAATPVGAAPASAPQSTTSFAAAAKEEVGYARIDTYPTHVLLPETSFEVSGFLGNKRPRTVHLKHTAGGTTTIVATATNTDDGLVTFTGVRVPKTGTLVVETPRARLQVPAGKATQARHLKAEQRVEEVLQTVRERKAKRAAALKALNKAKKTPGVSGRKMGRLLRNAGKWKAKLKSARKALKRARERVEVTEDALIKTVVVPRALSKPVNVTVAAKQSASAQALPPVAQAGPTAAAPTTGAVVSARFVPARAGRTVRLEKLEGGQWKAVGSQGQDRSGHAVFNVAEVATYRAVAEATEEATEVATGQVATRSWTTEFVDTFDGTSLDATKWQAQERPLETGLRTCAYTDGSSYSVGGGVLKLGVSKDPNRKDSCAYTDDKGKVHQLPYMRNTQIASLGNYSFKYGFAAARMKVQKSVGMHSGFWNQPMVENEGGRPDKGLEVDVMEYFGDYPRDDGIASFQHVLQADGTMKKIGKMFPETALMKGIERFSANYHVYSLEWTPTSYVFRVDGREYHRTNENISQVEQFLLLSMLTSSYELVNLKNFDDHASVDWVQVWK